MTTPFFTSVLLDIGLTLATVIFVVGLFIVQHFLLKKSEETMKRYVLITIYVFDFILMVASIGFLLYIWNYDIGVYLADLSHNFITFLEASINRSISSLLVIFVALLILRITKMSLQQLGQKESPNKRRKRTVSRVLRSISKYTVWIITIMIILSIWGVNVAPALAGLGILGLVIGLGAQKFINDLIAGFFIVFEHHFDVGDTVQVKGFKGIVTDIGLKTTKIKNWKNEVIILSNGEITDLINYSTDLSVAVIDFGIAYHEDAQKTMELLNLELPKLRLSYPEIVEDPFVVGVIQLNSSSVDMRVVCKTQNEQHYKIEREIRKRIKEILDENNIEIPFPQVVVHQPK